VSDSVSAFVFFLVGTTLSFAFGRPVQITGDQARGRAQIRTRIAARKAHSSSNRLWLA
jgi:hypothetical protein